MTTWTTIVDGVPVATTTTPQTPITWETISGESSAAVQTNLEAHIADPTGAHADSAITFTPAGTGAVARTAQDKMRESVSVNDFGAVGDGVTDDTAAIQAAITACGDLSFVLFPEGIYKVTSTITVKPKINIAGDGAEIKFYATDSNLFEYTPGSPTGYPGRIGFFNLKITGAGNSGSAWAINIDANAPFVVVQNCHITSFYGGIYLRDCYNSIIENTLVSTASFGIQLVRESHATTLRNNFVDHCTVAALAINYGGGEGTGAIHNITIDGGAYQNSPVGVWAEHCYALHTYNIYHEGNTTNDYCLGVNDSGTYARAVYNTTLDGFETSSACGDGVNVALSHSVSANIRNAAFNSGCSTTATLIDVDGYCDRTVVDLSRYTTSSVSDTSPIDTTDAPDRTVIYYRGRPIYGYAATDSTRFGTLASNNGRIYYGDGVSSRPSLIIEGQRTDSDLLLKVASSGLVRVANNSNSVYFDFDILNGKNVSYVPIVMKEYTVATLPDTGTYSRCFVTDANATTFNSVVVGGGANKVPVFYDGANWKIG